MFDVVQLWPGRRDFGSMVQDEVVKVFVVVDLVDEMIDTWCRLHSATLEWLWTNHLAIVDH